MPGDQGLILLTVDYVGEGASVAGAKLGNPFLRLALIGRCRGLGLCAGANRTVHERISRATILKEWECRLLGVPR
jgi:hypothetical protein